MTTETGLAEIERFTRARNNKARNLGFDLRKADNPNDGKRYTLSRNGMETHFATIDEALAKLKGVKP